MHKRFTLIASLAALVAIAIPVSAAIAGETVTGPDGNTQSMEATVSPKGALQEDVLARDPERRGEDRRRPRQRRAEPGRPRRDRLRPEPLADDQGPADLHRRAAAEHLDRSGGSGLRQGQDRHRSARPPCCRPAPGSSPSRPRSPPSTAPRRAANRPSSCTPTAPRRSRPRWSWSAPSPTSARKATARAST